MLYVYLTYLWKNSEVYILKKKCQNNYLNYTFILLPATFFSYFFNNSEESGKFYVEEHSESKAEGGDP